MPMTHTEKKAAQKLIAKLDGDCLCWFNNEATKDGPLQYPDFIILHPSYGLLCLEVKDWQPNDKIKKSTLSHLLCMELERSRKRANTLSESFSTIAEFQRQNQSPITCSYGVLLANIPRQHFNMYIAEDPRYKFPAHLAICTDEMDETNAPEKVQKRLWAMLQDPLDAKLSEAPIRLLRLHLKNHFTAKRFKPLVHQSKASLIPSLESCKSSMTNGERRFAERLIAKLDEDCICWYDIPIGKKRRYPDFIILHPSHGLLFIEVKDWKLESIKALNKQKVSLQTPDGIKSVAHPLEQAREYMFPAKELLSADRQLTQNDGKYKGKLLFPTDYGVVLTNISRRQFNQTIPAEKRDILFPGHLVVCKDEMIAEIDTAIFQRQLWDMFTYQFGKMLNKEQIDRIRWHLYPEIRIDQQQLFGSSGTEQTDTTPEYIQTMDLQQEKLARNLGSGHRVIHGVAGSGKTLILVYRCEYLAKAKLLKKPILVLCFNVTLAKKLQAVMKSKGLSREKVQVYNFHAWCASQLWKHKLKWSKAATDSNETKDETDSRIEKMVAKVAQGVKQKKISVKQYGAVMIDEGHDFEPEWLKLAVQMSQDSLLLLYDDAQSIYASKNRLGFSLSSVGIKAVGRTKILNINYRNTIEIARYADNFIKNYVSQKSADNDDQIPLLKPEIAGQKGTVPELKILKSADQEANYISSWLKKMHNQKIPWSSMCVLYITAWMGEKLHETIEKEGIPVQWLSTSENRKNYQLDTNSVTLMTMRISKGLEFPMVAIAGVGEMPHKKSDDVDQQAKILYVAITRSTKELLLTACKKSEFVKVLSGT